MKKADRKTRKEHSIKHGDGIRRGTRVLSTSLRVLACTIDSGVTSCGITACVRNVVVTGNRICIVQLVLVLGDSHIPHRAAEIPAKFQKMLVRDSRRLPLCLHSWKTVADICCHNVACIIALRSTFWLAGAQQDPAHPVHG